MALPNYPQDGESDGDRQSEMVRYDREDDRAPTESVLEAVAAVTGLDPTELQPLFEVVDPDALDQLFEPGPGSATRSSGGRITFRYSGCDVAIHAEGRTVATAVSDGAE